MNRPHDQPARLRLPLIAEAARELEVGQVVVLDGEVTITAGLPTHERMTACLKHGEPLPFDPGGSLLHLGGYSRSSDGRYELLYINPTTSTRFDPFMPRLVRGLGLRVVGGKGGLGPACVAALQEAGCVYLSFIGGACTVLSKSIESVVQVGWEEMPIHYRLVKLRVRGLGPCTVAIDAHGRSLYERGAQRARERLPAIMERLNNARRDSAQTTDGS